MANLILLHGRSADYKYWGNKMNLQKIADKTGFRIICPDGFRGSWYLDSSKMKWKSFFWNELWPELERRYSLSPENTFIDGLSMGGHGAVSMFLDHPERFRGAGSMSGVLNLQATQSSHIDLGLTEEEQVANSCYVRLDELEGKDMSDKLFVISCGISDKTQFPSAECFFKRCKELGYRQIYMITPGIHKTPCWCYALPYHIDWFTQLLKGAKFGE